MDNLIIWFDGVGEASMYVVDDKSYNKLYKIYDRQKPDSKGYDDMIEKFAEKFNHLHKLNNFKSLYLQWNSQDELEEPVTFKRVLQLL